MEASWSLVGRRKYVQQNMIRQTGCNMQFFCSWPRWNEDGSQGTVPGFKWRQTFSRMTPYSMIKNIKGATSSYCLCTADTGNFTWMASWEKQGKVLKSDSNIRIFLSVQTDVRVLNIRRCCLQPLSGHDRWNWSVCLDVTLVGNEMVKYLRGIKFNWVFTLCLSNRRSRLSRIILLVGIICGLSFLEPGVPFLNTESQVQST